MTTPSESTVTAIMQSETFQITARSLANQLHIPLKDARQVRPRSSQLSLSQRRRQPLFQQRANERR